MLSARDVLDKYVQQAHIFVSMRRPEATANPFLDEFLRPDTPVLERLAILFNYLAPKTNAGTDAMVTDESLCVGHMLLWLLTFPDDEEPKEPSYLPNSVDVLDVIQRLSQHPTNMNSDSIAVVRLISWFHMRRLDRLNDPQDLDIIIAFQRKLIDLPHPPDSSATVEMDQYFLGTYLMHKFKQNQDFETITDAIVHFRASIQGEGQNNPSFLSNFATALFDRYRRYGTREDIEASISLLLSAIRKAEDLLWPAARINVFRENLMAIRAETADLKESPGVIDDLIEEAWKIFAETHPNGSKQYALNKFNWASVILRKYELVGDEPLAVAAITAFEELIQDETALPSKLRLKVLGHLCLACILRYQRCKSPEASRGLNAALELGERTLNAYAGPEGAMYDNLDMAVLTMDMSHIYFEKYKSEGRAEDLEHAMRYNREIRTSHNLIEPNWQTSSVLAILSARTYHKEEQYEEAMLEYRAALQTLPKYLMLGTQYRAEAQQSESFRDHVGSDAAAACGSCGQFAEALEMLELGKSIAWTKLLQPQASLDKLQQYYPDHARRFMSLSESSQNISSLLSASASRGEEPGPVAGTIASVWEQHFNQTERWDALVEEIQALDGFENFLATPKYNQLKCAADEGPVIVFSIASYRSDVFILSSSSIDRPQVIRLPIRTDLLVEEWCKKLLRGVEDMRNGVMTDQAFGRAVLAPILRELWQIIIKPVRTSLMALAPYARRIWLCPSGRLTLLPLHLVVNGFNSSEKEGKIPLIPSYTPSLMTLLRARQGYSTLETPARLLVVSCDKVEGYAELRGAKAEIEIIRSLWPEFRPPTILKGAKATGQQVLTNMENHSWLHLACHGIQSIDEPYRSHFALVDGPLHLSDIISKHLQRAEFAFLSACETATGVPFLSDEAMHLAAGLQFAGYRGTIATMWSVHDKTAKKVAEKVYQILFRDSTREPNAREAAEALWHATESLREEGVPLARLAPFIHTGV